MTPPSARLRALLLAAAALLLLARLGATGFWAPDEPRYGQIAEEMRSMRHGPAGLVLLHLNGEPYTQKPPLGYWLAAALGAPFGRVTEAAARLPSALAGIGLVALTLGLGSRLLGGASGLLGAALLLTTFDFADNARRFQLDVPLALFEAVALAAFWRIDRGMGRRWRNQLLLHAALGLAVLTKGPVGLLVPGVVVASFLAWEGRLRALRAAVPWWGLALSAGPGLAWIASAVALAPAGFFGDAVVDNVLGRFLAGTSHRRPFYYYGYQLPLGLLPWFLAVPVVAWAARRQVFVPGAPDQEARRAWRFLLSWVGATLVFFTLSAGKRGLYVLPCYPAAALLLADALLRWIDARRALPAAFHVATGLCGLLLAGAGIFVAVRDPFASPMTSLAAGAGIAAIVAAALVSTLALRRARAPLRLRLAVPIVALWAVELLVFAEIWPARDPEKSPRAVAEAAAALVPADRAIGLVGDRALLGGLAYYGRRRVEYLGRREHVERFVAAGGSAIVVQARKLERVKAVTPVDVRFRARKGRRALLVVSPR